MVLMFLVISYINEFLVVYVCYVFKFWFKKNSVYVYLVFGELSVVLKIIFYILRYIICNNICIFDILKWYIVIFIG